MSEAIHATFRSFVDGAGAARSSAPTSRRIVARVVVRNRTSPPGWAASSQGEALA